MDPTTTSQPPQTSVDLIDYFNEQAWSPVDDWDGPTEAGADLKAYVEQLASVPAEKYRQQRWQMRVLSIVWPELKRWLQTWDLGLSFDAVYQEAKKRIHQHIKQPTPAQTEWLDALLTEADQKQPNAERKHHSAVIPKLSSWLTAEDYQALAEIAARDIAARVMQQSHQQDL